MRTTAGCLFMDKRKYSKPRLDIEQQVQLLEQQGLKIEDASEACRILKVVGYYRFSGYLHPFKLPHQDNIRRTFKPNITFNYIWNLYKFDRELRLLVSDAIEKIEVAFRASISDVTSKEYGLFWYTDNKFYRNPSQHLSLMRKIDGLLKKPEEVFLQHYLEKYHDPKYPPIWMIVEALSFGTVGWLKPRLYLKMNHYISIYLTIIVSLLFVHIFLKIF